MLKPHIIVRKNQIAVRFPFDLTVKDELKAAVPFAQRKWEPSTKYWVLSSTKENFEHAKRILNKKWGPDVIVLNETGNPQITFDTSIDTSSYYTILEISEDASAKEIKKAYRSLIVQLHPDKAQGEVDTKYFHLVQRAYETLKDEKRRKAYDLSRSVMYNHKEHVIRAKAKQPPPPVNREYTKKEQPEQPEDDWLGPNYSGSFST